MKRSRRAQTVLGDRHDLVCKILFASSVGRLRNSPGRIFQRLGTQTDVPRKSATDSSHGNQPRIRATNSSSILLAALKRSRRAQTVLGDRHDPICKILLQEPSAACGTRPTEFFNGWARRLKCDGTEQRMNENLIRQHGQISSQRNTQLITSSIRTSIFLFGLKLLITRPSAVSFWSHW